MSVTPDPTGAKVPASLIFERDLKLICEQFKGRRATRQTQNELRVRVIGLVRWLYEHEGHIIDYRDQTPILSADEVHVAVRFEHGELQVNVVRRRGRLQ